MSYVIENVLSKLSLMQEHMVSAVTWVRVLQRYLHIMLLKGNKILTLLSLVIFVLNIHQSYGTVPLALLKCSKYVTFFPLARS